MKTDNTTTIKCETVYTWRNKKTGEVFKEKKEGPDIVQDCTVKVDPKGLEIIGLGLDVNPVKWKNTVEEKEFNWINVSQFKNYRSTIFNRNCYSFKFSWLHFR